MKRFSFLVLALVFLFFCSCGSPDAGSVRLNRQSFAAGFKAEYRGVEYSGSVSLKDGITPQFVINKPEELNGCTVICNEKGVSCSFGSDYSDDINTAVLQRNPFSDVYTALNSVSDDAVFKKNGEGFYEYSTENFKIQTDARGNIVSLKTNESEFTFT